MTSYSFAYRYGITPWERYTEAAGRSISGLLDREEAARSRPLGRALDLGCGRGLYTRALASCMRLRPRSGFGRSLLGAALSRAGLSVRGR